MITIKKSSITSPPPKGNNSTSTGSTPQTTSKAKTPGKSPPPVASVIKGGQHIYYPKLYQLRVEQGLHRNEDRSLTPAQLGLESLDKCHHVSITNPTKDGPQSYRVRICKTCCNSDTHIELGTYIDQESAILVNDVHEILIGRFDKLIVLRPEDKPFLGKLSARKYDRHRGRDESNILQLLTERNFGEDKKKRSRNSTSESDNNLDVFSDEVETDFSNLSNYGDDISMIDSIGEDGKLLIFSESGNSGQKINLYTDHDNHSLPFGTFSAFIPSKVDNSNVMNHTNGFFFGPNDFGMTLGPEHEGDILGISEFNPDFNSSGVVGAKRPFGDLFVDESGMYDNNNMASFYDIDAIGRSRGNSSLVGSDNMRSRSGSRDIHLHINAIAPSNIHPNNNNNNNNNINHNGDNNMETISTQFSNHDVALLSDVAIRRRSPMRPLARPRSSSFNARSGDEYLDLLNQPLTPMSTLRVFASMNDSEFSVAKGVYSELNHNKIDNTTNMGPPRNIMVPNSFQSSVVANSNGIKSQVFPNVHSISNNIPNNIFSVNNSMINLRDPNSMMRDSKGGVDNLMLPAHARQVFNNNSNSNSNSNNNSNSNGNSNNSSSQYIDPLQLRRTVSLQSPIQRSVHSEFSTSSRSESDANINDNSSSMSSINNLLSDNSNSNSMSVGEDDTGMLRTKSSKDLIASLTSLKTCFKDEVYFDFDNSYPKSTRSVSSGDSSSHATGSDSTTPHSTTVGFDFDNDTYARSPTSQPGRARSYSMPALSENMPTLPGGRVRPDSSMQEFKEMGGIGAYTAEERKVIIRKFLEKRKRRIWAQKVKYDVRKVFADSRVRVKGRFVKKDAQIGSASNSSNSEGGITDNGGTSLGGSDNSSHKA